MFFERTNPIRTLKFIHYRINKVSKSIEFNTKKIILKNSLEISLIMDNIEDIIQSLLDITGLDTETITKLLEIPPDPKMGDLAFPCFQLAKKFKKSPKDIASELQGKIVLSKDSLFGFCTATGPYINFFYDTKKLAKNTLNLIWKKKAKYGYKTKNKKVILVESPSPNTNKPLHLGHLRNMALGLATANIVETQGYTVKKINLFNDRGVHICKSMLAYQQWGNNQEPDKKSDHFVGDYYVLFEKKKLEDPTLDDQAKAMLVDWEQGKPEVVALWKKMNTWAFDGYEETFKRFGLTLDKNYYESQVYTKGKEIILQGLEDGVFVKDETGAVIAELDKKLGTKVLLRSDGTAVYMTQDIYLARAKHDDFNYDKSIYVVASEQDYHFQVLFTILKKLKFPYADGCYHLSYGMVNLPEGRMKSREGKVVDADDLMDELADMAKKELEKREADPTEDINDKAHKIGLAALKYYLIKYVPIKDFTFNPEESISFEGESGPYLQYSYVRIQKILKKLDYKIDPKTVSFDLLEHDSEITLVKQLYEYPQVLEMSASAYDPSKVAQYVNKVCQSLNVFYENCRVLGVEKELEIARAFLLQCVAIVIKSGLNLLGIETVESM